MLERKPSNTENAEWSEWDERHGRYSREVAVERRGSSRDTNADIRKAKQLVGIWTLD